MTNLPLEEPVLAPAISAFEAGQPVLLVDDEGVGNLVLAGSRAAPTTVGFVIRHGSGFLRVTVDAERCRDLALPPAVGGDHATRGPRVPVDLKGAGTGISARDRAATIVGLASSRASAEEFSRPGHVVPILVGTDGLLEQQGVAEAAADLARLAGLPPVTVFAEVESSRRPGEFATGPELDRFVEAHGLARATSATILEVRRRAISAVERASDALVPTDFGVFRTIAYVDRLSGREHLALVPASASDADPSVEVHLECWAGQVLRSTACGCRQRFQQAMGRAGRGEAGVVLYLRADASFAPCVGSSPLRPGLLPWLTRSILDDLGRLGAVARRPDEPDQRPRWAS